MRQTANSRLPRRTVPFLLVLALALMVAAPAGAKGPVLNSPGRCNVSGGKVPASPQVRAYCARSAAARSGAGTQGSGAGPYVIGAMIAVGLVASGGMLIMLLHGRGAEGGRPAPLS
jgi:hypothetical protein